MTTARDRDTAPQPQTPLSLLLQRLPVVIALVLFGLACRALYQSLERYPLSDIWQSVTAIPLSSIALALLLTWVNYGTLTGYDTLGMRYALGPRVLARAGADASTPASARRPDAPDVPAALHYWQTALVAVIAYGISNNIGLNFLSGGAVRYRFYRRWGVSAGAIAQGIVFCNLSFWVGFLAVSGFLFVNDPETVAQLLHLDAAGLRPMGALFWGVLGGYLAWSLWARRALRFQRWGLNLHLPPLSFPLALGQMGVTLADWVSVALLLYVLLPAALLPPFLSFLGLYLLAKVAGVLSNVPGGLGVFETVLLLSLAPPESSMPQVLGVFLAYRGIYYWVPLAIAVLTWMGYELKYWQSDTSEKISSGPQV